MDIDKKLWQEKDKLIDEFIDKNEYNLTKEELSTIKEFKNSITDEHFIIIGYEREYTKILSEKEGKI